MPDVRRLLRTRITPRNHWRELGSLPKKEAMLQYLFLAQQIIQSLQQVIIC